MVTFVTTIDDEFSKLHVVGALSRPISVHLVRGKNLKLTFIKS